MSIKKTPNFAQQMWRHMAVSRAYEFGTYVGVSDFAAGWPRLEHGASGVAGLADSTAVDPMQFFRPVGAARIAPYDLRFDDLDALREDRAERGFLNHSRSSLSK